MFHCSIVVSLQERKGIVGFRSDFRPPSSNLIPSFLVTYLKRSFKGGGFKR